MTQKFGSPSPRMTIVCGRSRHAAAKAIRAEVAVVMAQSFP